MHTFLWYIHIRRHASSPHLLHDALRDDDNNNNAHPHRRGRAFITDISRGTWAITCARFLCIVTRYNVAHTCNECTWSQHGAESNAIAQHLSTYFRAWINVPWTIHFGNSLLFLFMQNLLHSLLGTRFFFFSFYSVILISFYPSFSSQHRENFQTENLRSSGCGNRIIIIF